jgi:D-sedoheptulose 7-phosphate isomerase
LKENTQTHLASLIKRFPNLNDCHKSIISVFEILADAFKENKKLLLCGNGGSAADCEHIAGELGKGFLDKRALKDDQVQLFASRFGQDGRDVAANLQNALPTISLVSNFSLNTAFANDVNPHYVFAQQVWGLGQSGDVLWGISTSGNSQNVNLAAQVAQIKAMKVIALTGPRDSKLSALADVTIKAPGPATHLIQENHLPIYHTICAMLEAELF